LHCRAGGGVVGRVKPEARESRGTEKNKSVFKKVPELELRPCWPGVFKKKELES